MCKRSNNQPMIRSHQQQTDWLSAKPDFRGYHQLSANLNKLQRLQPLSGYSP